MDLISAHPFYTILGEIRPANLVAILNQVCQAVTPGPLLQGRPGFSVVTHLLYGEFRLPLAELLGNRVHKAQEHYREWRLHVVHRGLPRARRGADGSLLRGTGRVRLQIPVVTNPLEDPLGTVADGLSAVSWRKRVRLPGRT